MNYWDDSSKDEQGKLIFKSLPYIREYVSAYGKMNPQFIQDPEGSSHLQYVKTWRWLEEEPLYGKYRDIFDLAIYGVITSACEYNPEKGKSFNPEIHIQQLICDGDSNKGIKGVLRIRNWKDLSDAEHETLIFRWLPLMRKKVHLYGQKTPQTWEPTQNEFANSSQQLQEKDAGNTKTLRGQAKSSHIQKWGWLENEILYRMYPDIFDLAILGVMKAAEEYELEKGINFNPETYIIRLILDGDKKRGIEGVFSDEPQTVKTASGAEIKITQKMVNEISNELRQKLAKEPLRHEIAEEMLDIYFPDVQTEKRADLKLKITIRINNIIIKNMSEKSIEDITKHEFDNPQGTFNDSIDQEFDEPQNKMPIISQTYVNQPDIIKAEEINNMHEAMRTLPIKWQQAFNLFYFDELSYEEIARILETPKHTITYWLQEGKKRMKNVLKNLER
jgi:RNA polymerase sigma factor (sigma-70 family)